MKALTLLLKSENIDTDTLRVLFEQDSLTTFALTLDGDIAVTVWERLETLVPKTERWPVLLGQPGEEDLPTLRDWPKVGAFAAILAEAEKSDARALLDGWHEKNLANIREMLARDEADGAEEDAEYSRERLRGPEEYQGIPRGAWPEDAEPTSPWSVAFRVTHRVDADSEVHSKPVTLALLPTPRGWETPAVMKFGGWNSNPYPAHHVAILRYWHERYGARVAAMTHDTIEMMVNKPPTTREGAMELARDQYHYCEDNVLQGSYTLEALAGGLLRGEAWYFWWD